MKFFLCIIIFFCFSFAGWANYEKAPSQIENYIYYHLHHNQPEAAFNFLKSLEENNHAEGMFFLGLFYLNGYGVKKDLALANVYFFKAGHRGFYPAFKELADSYLGGEGIEKNPELALYYYECAARQGYGPGQFNAGVLLKEGKLVGYNPKKAFYWLDQAAHNPDLVDLKYDAQSLRDEIKF
jgi:TPR repeat protein